MKKITLYIITVMAVILCSCQSKHEGSLEGVIANANGEKLVLEHLSTGMPVIVDTLILKEDGKFSFKPELEVGGPDFFSLRIGNQSIPLAFDTLMTPVKVNADFKSFGTSYTVDDELNQRLKEAAQIGNVLRRNVLEANASYSDGKIDQATYYNQIAGLVNTYKQDMLHKYIYQNPSDPVAYYVLFESVRGLSIFDPYDSTDNKAFGAVATGWMYNYPNSPRVAGLEKVTKEGQVLRKRDKLEAERADSISKAMPITVANNFEVVLNDIHDQPVALSSLISEDHVVLIDFTAYYLQSSPAHNALLSKMYSKYKDRGLVIYQICLDPDENFWKVSANNVPWIAVRDKDVLYDNDGNIQYSRAAALYNVQQLPMIYLLDRSGSVTARVETESKLEGEILKLLK